MMSKHALDPVSIQRFEQEGYLSPIRVFDDAEAGALRERFETFERQYGREATFRRTDLHLIKRWAWEAAVDPRIVDRVVSLLGPDVLLWSINWFIKDAGDGTFVSLHQDANYWGLTPHEVVTAWVALSDAPIESGPMSFLPGSHRDALHEHDNTYEAGNLLTRGQTIRRQIAQSDLVSAPLAAGEMSLHHVRLIHGSGPNEGSDRRIGMVLRFCSTRVRQTKGEDTAVLVAGRDRFGHFELLEPPPIDDDARALEVQRNAVSQLGRMLMQDEPTN